MDSQGETFLGRLFFKITASPVRFLVTLLLGNTLALVVFGVFTASVLEKMLSHYTFSRTGTLFTQTLITTVIILVVADFIPKSLFRINSNSLLKLFAFPCIIVYYILLPFTYIILKVAQLISVNLFGESLFKNTRTFTKKDLFTYVDDYAQVITEEEKEGDQEVQLFRNALMFPDVKVKDCMVSRLEIIAMDVSEGPEKLKEKFLQTGLSRILVYDGKLENVLGYVHYHELFKNPADIKNILLPAPLIPESMLARDALRIFLQQRKSMAAVVDEYGVVAGILTTEDIIEEIFGEIEDEYDEETLLEREIMPGEYLFSGRLEIDYLNEKYHFDLPVSSNYTSLGGLITYTTGSIPKAKESLSIADFQIKIVSATPTRIDQVHFIYKKPLM